jgi:hypothetical protein
LEDSGDVPADNAQKPILASTTMNLEPFIDLNRSFAPMARDRDFSDESFDVHLELGLPGKVHWKELLEKPRVVILAEAGAGKTREFKEIALRLQREGKFAFPVCNFSKANSPFRLTLFRTRICSDGLLQTIRLGSLWTRWPNRVR